MIILGMSNIYWITGQPGAGKTTLGKELSSSLIDIKRELCFHIDGDDIRDLFDNKDYSEEGRRKNIQLAQQISQYLNSQSVNVVVSLVSPYKDQREEFKKKMGRKITEIYVHTSEIRGRENLFVDDYESPTENFINIDTTNIGVNECIKKILNN
jgi:adenylylsulfate kinase-like enzyme